MSDSKQNGWNEYSKLVINELERLNDGISNLNTEIQSLKKEIVELKGKEENYRELRLWKQAVDEVASPTQLKETIKDVSDLKTFKTQAVTVFLIVQAAVGISIALLKFFAD
jgi:ribosomal protein L29|tara:strand:- start:752 stop:1084 length:333 start_codon:yes stop_codon:yes gene_type:complete